MYRTLFMFTGVILMMVLTSSCVAKDPVHDVVIQQVKDAMQAEFSEDMAMVEKITIFEATMKVYMADQYSPEKLRVFARALTKTYGEKMRENQKLEQVYHVTFFQKKLIDEKKQLKAIAECQFENASDRVTVKDLGLGEGKYDVYK